MLSTGRTPEQPSFEMDFKVVTWRWRVPGSWVVIASLGLALASPAITRAASFEPTVIYPILGDVATGSPVVGDLDEDGRLDVVGQDRTLPGVALWMSSAAGPLVEGPHLAISGCVSFKLARVDSDAHLDLVVMRSAPSPRVEVFRGLGNGNFMPGVESLLTTLPAGWCVGEVTGDASLDLVAVGTASFDILSGNGSGGFTPLSTTQIPAGYGPSVVADLNGDAQSEIVLSRARYDDGAATVLVVRDDVISGWVVDQSLPGPACLSISFTVRDLDMDNRPDILVASECGGAELYWNQGDGTFGATTLALEANPDSLLAAKAAQAAGAPLFWNGSEAAGDAELLLNAADEPWVPADLDGDGRPELVRTARSVGGRLGTARIRADRSVAEFFDGALGGNVENRYGAVRLAAGDADGDGREEVFALLPEPPGGGIFKGLAVVTRRRGAHVSLPELYAIPATDSLIGIGDVSPTPGPELVFRGPGGVRVTRERPDGDLDPFEILRPDVRGALPPFSGGGHRLIALSNGTITTLEKLIGSGMTTMLGSIAAPAVIASGDLNGDGLTDVIAHTLSGGVTPFLGQSGGGFTTAATLEVPGDGWGTAFSLGDLDRDGHDELIVGVDGPGVDGIDSLVVYGLAGSSVFQRNRAITFGPFSDNHGPLHPSFVAVAEFSGDSRPDLLLNLGGPGHSNLRLLVQLADGSFDFRASPGRIDSEGYPTPAYGDLDGDGDLDVASTGLFDGYSSALRIGFNDGSGGEAGNFFTFLPTYYTREAYVGDLDSDGAGDVAAWVALTASSSPSVVIAHGKPQNFPTAVRFHWLEATAGSRGVHLRWGYQADPGTLMTLERWSDSSWNIADTQVASGSGSAEFTDSHAASGASHRYRVLYVVNGKSLTSPEVVVTLRRQAITLRVLDSARSSSSLRLALDSLQPGPARLDLFDVGGRRIAELRMHATAPSQTVDWSLPGSMASGLYWISLDQSGERVSTRVAIAK
ncbi:MAG: VCBS repeat-containing protein [Candidatus Eisenbacteria bacterium]|uniref:VCBS repeat-containing protein n=1 Tax=Eiseniibacteriota bacterium TaxID=2212470 RepID=A0A849SNP2_UNCEI|nr:VCBS repeat-containing protein [Candidatus Eisenbacteria bacterium]